MVAPKPVQVLMGEVLAELPAIGKAMAPGSGLKYAFRGIEAVLDMLNPLLSERGLFVVPCEVVSVSETARETRGGTLTYNVRVVMLYRWYGPAGDFIQVASTGEGSDTQDKATQKAMTSAFKYMLFETFAISTEEGAKSDIDATQDQEETVLSAQEQRKRAWGDKPLPEGWADFEEYDTETQTYAAGLQELPKLEADHMKEYRRSESIPWPDITKADFDRLCAEVIRIKNERFTADDAAPEPTPEEVAAGADEPFTTAAEDKAAATS